MLLAMQTRLRVSELTGLRRTDVSLDLGAHLRCERKGRKQRVTPLTRRPSKCHARGWPRTPTSPLTRCFPPATVAGSAATPSSDC
jgi:integrase/recombinase XerD